MPNKIVASTASPLSLLSGIQSARDKTVSNSVAATAPTAAVDKLSLTGDAVRLQQLDQASSLHNGIDMARVTKTRAAIASGSYQIDSKQIAAKLTRMDWDLGGK